MFTDDAFAPTNCEDYAEYDYDTTSNETFDIKKVNDVVKRADKRYHSVVRRFGKVGRDGKFHNSVKVEYYGSGDTGSNIRDAVTGRRTKHIVGTTDQDLYFSVSVSTGENKRVREPVHLFYASPEEYEKNQYMELSDKVKSAWRERYNKTKLRYDK